VINGYALFEKAIVLYLSYAPRFLTENYLARVAVVFTISGSYAGIPCYCYFSTSGRSIMCPGACSSRVDCVPTKNLYFSHNKPLIISECILLTFLGVLAFF
jgi:hypothetical protein